MITGRGSIDSDVLFIAFAIFLHLFVLQDRAAATLSDVAAENSSPLLEETRPM